jgi:hypothetical protein
VPGTRLRSGIVSRRLSSGLRILVLFLATSILGGRPLFAMPPAQGEVKVVVAGSDRAFAALTKSLTESLSFIAVTPQFERVATVDPHSVSQSHLPVKEIFARLWIDAAADYDVTLYITDAATERVFVRRIGLDHGLDKVAVESLALVVQSSLEALLAGKLIGVTRNDYEQSLQVAAPRPVPQQAAAPTPHPNDAHDVRPRSWQLWAGYELQGWDGSTVRHEAALGLEYERWRLRFGVDLYGTWPIQFHNGDLGAELFSNGIRLGVSRPLALPHQLRFVPGLGFAMELTRVRPELDSPNAQPASPYFAFDPAIRAVVGIERSWGRWSLRGILGVDFTLRPVNYYVVTSPAETEVVRTPWRERPFAAIILAARL